MLPNNLYPLKGLQGRLDNGLSNQPVVDFSINPLIVNSKIQNDTLIFTFNNMCFNNKPIPGELKVNQSVLKQKLNSWIRPQDRKYIKLADFNNQNSKFVFDIDSWLEDGIKSYTTFATLGMSKTYKLGKQLPYMVSVYGNEFEYGKYIAEKFRRKLKQYPELRKNIFGIVEDVSRKHLKMDSVAMFEYKYSRINNTVSVSVKPVYLASIAGAISIMAKDDSWKKKVNFDKTVGMFLKFKS